MTLQLESSAANDNATISKTAAKYVAVNGAWPLPSNLLPTLTAKMAVKAFRALYRHRFHKPWHLKVVPVRGRRRRTWTDANPKAPKIGSKEWRKWGLTVMIVAPDAGWHNFIHDLSHWMHSKQYPDQNAHKASSHAAVEMDLIEQVVKRGWLDEQPKETVKVPKPKPDLKAVRYQRVLASIKTWESKMKRAQTALKKLRRKQKYYER